MQPHEMTLVSRILVATFALAASAASASRPAIAQEVVQTCPATSPLSSSPLKSAQLFFSTASPQALAMCLYEDGTPLPMTLQGRCELAPVDTFMDGGGGGSGGGFSAGMHLCAARGDPLRCKFTCRPL